MSGVHLAAEPRVEFGKGAARRFRRAGKVPAALYSRTAEPIHIALPSHQLMMALKTANVLFELDLQGKKHLALPRDVQRHPVRDYLQHVNLLLVKRGEKVTVEVPVRAAGELAPGGLLGLTLTTLSVQAEATRIPQAIEISIEGLQVGDGVYAKDVTLPSGVTLDTEPDAMVLHVMAAPTAEQVEAELAAAEAEAGIEQPEPVAAAEEKTEASTAES